MQYYSVYFLTISSAIISFVRVSCESSFVNCIIWDNGNISQSLSIAFGNISCNPTDFPCYIRTCFLNDGFGIFLLAAFSTLVLLLILLACVICIGLASVCVAFCFIPRKPGPVPIISRYSRRRQDVSFQNSNPGANERSIIMSGVSTGRNKSNFSGSIMYESFHLEDHSHIASTSSKYSGAQEIEVMKIDRPKNLKPKTSYPEADISSPTSRTGLTMCNENIAAEGYGFDDDSVIYEEVFTIYDAFEKGRDLNQKNDSMSRIAFESSVKKDLKTATIVLSNSQREQIGSNYDTVFGQVPNSSLEEVKYFRRESRFMTPSTDISTIYDDLANLKIREINRKTLSFNEELGHGNFAVVYQGIWSSNYGDIPVAVKVLNKQNQPDQLVGVLREAAAMAQFDHPNIIKLLGVVTLGKPCVIVSELMKDQLTYFLYKLNKSPIPKSKFPPVLLKFCSDICLGMEYLAGLKFVHRDLAARNVLVALNLSCRIADFGMCRELRKESDYYKASGGSIPVRWAAPESVFYQRYSEQSDVWSFGMTMYEIWALGVKPWHNFSTEEVVDILLKQDLPTPPTGCPRNIYELMIEIWNQDPESRPSFQGLKQKLKAIKLPNFTSIEPAQIPGNDPSLAKDMYLTLQKRYVQK